MKLVELAKLATKHLQDAGEKGINNIELAEKLQMPRRRVYDIIAILQAAGLVEVKREKGGTRLFWVSIASIKSAAEPSDNIQVSEKYKSEITELKAENDELKEKIKRLRENVSKGDIQKVSEKKMFESSGIIVRAAKTLKISEVLSSGIEVTIKATGKGLIVEPFSED